MTMQSPLNNQVHSTGWIVQAWASFALSVGAMSVGILNLPVDNWVGSTISMAKTTRDNHEAKRLTARVDEARVEKLLSEHHPLK